MITYSWVTDRNSPTVTIAGAALHLLMLHNLMPGVAGLFNGIFWTLGVEFPYYILMALIGGLIRNPKRLWQIFALAIFISIVFRYGVFVFVDSNSMSGLGRFFASTQVIGALDAFALGGIAYVVSTRLEIFSRTNVLLIASTGCIVLLSAIYYLSFHLGNYWNQQVMVVVWRTWLAIGFGLVILAAAKSTMPWIKFTGLPALGRIGFSCYLWHFPTIKLLSKTSAWLSPEMALFCASILTLALSWLSWRFIEQRFHTGNL